MTSNAHLCFDLSHNCSNIRRLGDTFQTTIRQVDMMRSVGQLQMMRGSVPPANQVARRILPMVTVSVEVQCTVRIDRYVFEHFE